MAPTGSRANFTKFSFQKYQQRPAITRRGPSHTLTLWPVTQARLKQHVGQTVTRVTRHAHRRTAASPAHSPQRTAASCPSLSTARLARRSPSHSQRSAVTRRCPPPPAAGSHGSHSQRPAVTRSSPPQSTRPSHSQRPVSLRWRHGAPLLAAASLTDSVTGCCSGVKAEVYFVARIWNTLVAIFGTP